MSLAAMPTISVPSAPTTVRVRIDVTREDIAAGKRGEPGYCPIALAMLRAFDRPAISKDALSGIRFWPLVCNQYLLLPSGARAAMPPSASVFVDRFDAGASVTPFVFTVEIPIPDVSA